MKRLMRIKTILLLFIGSVVLHGCVTENTEVIPNERASETVSFKISIPAGSQPKSRALSTADEYAVSDVSVLAFNKTDKKFKGRYSGRIVSGPTQISGASASMTFEVSLPQGDLDLMIVANANTMLNNCSALTVGTPQATIEEALTMSMGTSGWNSASGSPTLMPMWGYVKSVNVPDNFPLSTIYLTRMVAKVDVLLGGTLVDGSNVPTGDFLLKEVYVYNYAEQGRLIPNTDEATNGGFNWTAVNQSNLADNLTPSLPAGYTKADIDTERLSYTLASPYQSLTNTIYLFEAPKGVKPESGSDTYWGNTCLVVGGSYDDHATTYYRIDFAQRSDEGSVTTYNYLNILRNNSYTVTITGVSGDGHGSPEEAVESAPTNITATILDWNNHNITTIVTDGIYMLGVSQGRFELSAAAHTTSSDDNHLTIVTNHSGGWSATVWADEAGETALPNGSSGQAWLRLSSASGNGNYPNGNPIQLILDPNGPEGDREAYIHILAGQLNYIVKVTQGFDYYLESDVEPEYELDSQTETMHVRANFLWEIISVTDEDDILQNEDALIGQTGGNNTGTGDELSFTMGALSFDGSKSGKTATIAIRSKVDASVWDIVIKAIIEPLYVGYFGGELKANADGVWQFEYPLFVQREDESAGVTWGPRTAVNVTNLLDGKGNTYTLNGMTATDHPAANLCFKKNKGSAGITGISDPNYNWYLPAQKQLMAIRTVHNSFGITYQFSADIYWSASEYSANYAWYVDFSNGVTSGSNQELPRRVRCVREL